MKDECLSKVILFGERSLRRAVSEYVEHFHAERNHQGKGNVLLFPRDTEICRTGPIQCRERLGGLLRYSLSYACTYLIIGVATELRYLLWSLIAIFTSVVISLSELRMPSAKTVAYRAALRADARI